MTFEVDDHLRKVVELAAEHNGMSVTDQIGQWIRMGQLMEEMPKSYRDDLEKEVMYRTPDRLTYVDDLTWLIHLGNAAAGPSPYADAFFADRRRRGIGVGLDKDGNVVRQQKES